MEFSLEGLASLHCSSDNCVNDIQMVDYWQSETKRKDLIQIVTSKQLIYHEYWILVGFSTSTQLDFVDFNTGKRNKKAVDFENFIDQSMKIRQQEAAQVNF